MEKNYNNELIKVNKEIEKSTKVVIEGVIKSCIFTYKFNKEVKYIINIIPDNLLKDMS